MSISGRVIVFLLWMASLLAIGALVKAQSPPSAASNVLSGADIGFRVTGRNKDVPTGTIVIRVNGQWVVPKLDGAVVPAAH
jgi:hypothetical protein